MTIGTRIHTIAALLSVIGALLILGGTAQAATSQPAGMSNTQYQALVLRSEALNREYRLGSDGRAAQGMKASALKALLLRSEALNSKYGLGGDGRAAQGTTASALQALLLRSEALNRKYHLGGH